LLVLTVRALGEVTAVGSERDAKLELLAEPDVVVMDLGLPHIRWDLLEHAAQAAGRVVVVTGHVEPVIVERAYAAGASLVLTKPFRPRELAAAVRGPSPG
jgi:CheY-like chemotaxis protein